jgi:hypothetical protein
MLLSAGVAGRSYRVSALAKASIPSETGYLGVMSMDATAGCRARVASQAGLLRSTLTS